MAQKDNPKLIARHAGKDAMGSLILNYVYSQSHLDGSYVGLVEMCYINQDGTKACYKDPANPRAKWYHLTQYHQFVKRVRY